MELAFETNALIPTGFTAINLDGGIGRLDMPIGLFPARLAKFIFLKP